MKEVDSLQRFIFENAPIRGEIVHIEKTYQTILEQHNYPPMVRNILGEALVSCLLLASSIKFEGSLNLQFQGDKRLPLVLVQCDNQLNVRAFAQFEEQLETSDYAQAFLAGKMAIMINPDKQTNSYQSLIPIQTTSMSENLMNYFAQSEQISTKVWLAANETAAGGMLLQLMPEQAIAQREQFWEYAVQLGQTITAEELLNLDNKSLLYRLYHESEVRIFDPRPIQFKCRCSDQKMKQVLRVLGRQEAEELIKEHKIIDVRCDFCNKNYAFDSIDISLLFHEES